MKTQIVLAVAILAALSGCAGKQANLPLGIGTIGSAQDGDFSNAVALLEKGQWKDARRELRAILKKNPADAGAAKLLRQIDSDPKTLLGKSSFAYRVRAGDSFQSLAQRYLGDRLMFYALARYNGVLVPEQIPSGLNLRIPGVERAADPRPAAPKAAQPAAASPRPAAPRAASPAVAAALRRQGLSALAKGNPNGAVSLLARAASADPANKLIAADLARARRVQAAVR